MNDGVVQLELLDRVAQRLVLGRVDGIEAAETIGLTALKPGSGSAPGCSAVGDGVADLASRATSLIAGHDEADLARAELRHLDRPRREDADARDIELVAARHQLDARCPWRIAAVEDAARAMTAPWYGIEPAVEDERPQRRGEIARGGGMMRTTRLEDLVDADALLRAREQRPGCSRDR